ncbi:MAG: AAA family ATPase, partial [Desulfamplus sp.]|nr:AAA family ATPase [Desulfamplus sp.]
MKKLLNLPTGDSSFESIRYNKYLYVDKTKHIYQMIDSGKYYFLSRPRRFGKSLTVSTLNCIFQGKKELFKGLWIADNRDLEWKEHPVIMIDFNQISHDTSENFIISLSRSLVKTAEIYGVSSDAPLLKDQFKELVISLYQKTGMPVVILIDEYDKPMIDHIGKGENSLNIAKANREILKNFMGVIKGGDVTPVVRFVFITGVSKFSRVSIFSELNNLSDLTMNRNYADMLGYTQAELESYFSGHIQLFAQELGETSKAIFEKLKNYYNGYRFSEIDIKVYNPFSVLNSLEEKAFKNYWFETGTPTFLVNLLKEKNCYPPAIENMQVTEALFSMYDLEHFQPEALLFQTGYVTIKDVEERLYTFGYPNNEVKTAFLENLFYSYTAEVKENSKFMLLSKYLREENFNDFIDTMRAIYASIPYTLENRRDESYFHTIFYLMVSASGVTARNEVLTCNGRIDLVIEFLDKIFIIEFKCNQSADAALEQILDRGYERATKYERTAKHGSR